MLKNITLAVHKKKVMLRKTCIFSAFTEQPFGFSLQLSSATPSVVYFYEATAFLLIYSCQKAATLAGIDCSLKRLWTLYSWVRILNQDNFFFSNLYFHHSPVVLLIQGTVFKQHINRNVRDCTALSCYPYQKQISSSGFQTCPVSSAPTCFYTSKDFFLEFCNSEFPFSPPISLTKFMKQFSKHAYS